MLIKPSVISVIGAGGKTSLICSLAYQYLSNNLSVCITTTTKMQILATANTFFAQKGEILSQGLIFHYNNKTKEWEKYLSNKSRIERNGFNICYLEEDLIKENLNQEKLPFFCQVGKKITEEKIGSIKEKTLQELAKRYQVVLVEADGAKGKPLKGWRNFEPVIADISEQIIMVIDGSTIFRPISEKNIFALDLFKKQFVKREEEITPDIYRRILDVKKEPWCRIKNIEKKDLYCYISHADLLDEKYQELIIKTISGSKNV